MKQSNTSAANNQSNQQEVRADIPKIAEMKAWE